MPHVLKKEYKSLWHKCRKWLSWGVILLVSLQDNSKERVTCKKTSNHCVAQKFQVTGRNMWCWRKQRELLL